MHQEKTNARSCLSGSKAWAFLRTRGKTNSTTKRKNRYGIFLVNAWIMKTKLVNKTPKRHEQRPLRSWKIRTLDHKSYAWIQSFASIFLEHDFAVFWSIKTGCMLMSGDLPRDIRHVERFYSPTKVAVHDETRLVDRCSSWLNIRCSL